jgi:penicillin-binding protein 1A
VLITLAKGAVLTVIWGSLALAVILLYYGYDLPDVHQVAQHVRRPAVTLVAADGTRFSRTGEIQGAIIDVNHLPRILVQAVIAVEDRRFYHHFGIDPIGLARAVYVNLRHEHMVQGGSTITQQLAKNLFLSPDRTLRRKIQEAMLALWLEHVYSKDQILTAYLNRVYLGAGAYGVDAAAQTYFGKPVSRLTLREAATIAGLLKAPSRYSPVNNPDEAAQRAQVVLETMVEAGFITPAELAAASLEPPSPRPATAAGLGRYFADWISDHVGSYIGYDHEDLVVFTTLDLRLQQAAERRLAELLATQGPQNQVSQGALVALSPDGAVRALVGGRNYSESPFNRATQALRQPGSSFKPFIYLAALGAGFTPETTVEDAPLRIGHWQPANYEKEFRGLVPLRDALAHSINTCAVRVLEQVGIDRVRSLAQRLGITSPLSHDLSLALGTSEVTPIELTAAYAGIANGGRPVIPHAILEIRDSHGTVLYKRHGSVAEPVADPTAVSELTGMMTAVLAYGTGKAARLDRPAAGKTGTSSDYRDAWFAGFTADYVAAVWLGNDNNDEMKKVTGGGLPAKLWHDFMMDAHAGLPVRPLPYATDIAPLSVAQSPGAAATPVADDGLQSLITRLTGTAHPATPHLVTPAPPVTNDR